MECVEVAFVWLFLQLSPSMAHYDTFRTQLAITHPAFGHALWEPDPGAQYPAVEVGDVGFIRQGKFHRLFNVLFTDIHPSNQRFGVPEDHKLLTPVPNHIDPWNPLSQQLLLIWSRDI